VWADSEHGIARFDDLGIRFIRITKGSASWEQLQSLRAITDNLGIEWVYTLWQAPRAYQNRDGYLIHVPGFARHWRTVVEELDRRGLRPHYIELMNEPDSDGTWSTAIRPSDYNALVKQTRLELDRAGFEDVGIVGPGVAHLNWLNHNSEWIDALDDVAVDELAAWSTHGWDDGDACHGGAACIERQWPEFAVSADTKDPAKPKWITEYATRETTFRGVKYPHPDETGGYSAAHSMPYAVRVYENTLALLNAGASAAFYWFAEDRSTSWGYVDAAGKRKPVFHTLKSLWSAIPVGARVVKPPDQSRCGVYAGAFVHRKKLTIGLANDGDVERETRIRITGTSRLEIVEATACVWDRRGDPATETPDTCRTIPRSINADRNGVINVALPGYSTLTIECECEPAAGPIGKQ
jgi:hypothetical protein